MNDTTAAYRLREQLRKFLGIVFPHAPKAQKEFLGQMFLGIQAGQSVVLSRIARELQEDILLKKTEGRRRRLAVQLFHQGGSAEVLPFEVTAGHSVGRCVFRHVLAGAA